MKQVNKSVLLWYSPREMYDLVTAVEDYPKFLPWCSKAEVVDRSGDTVTARLHLSYMGVSQAFTTRNTQVEGESVKLDLVDGPFSQLGGLWKFVPIGKAGETIDAASAQACRVEFQLNYAFSSLPLELVVSPVFDRIANTFVDSFVKRAQAVYGER